MINAIIHLNLKHNKTPNHLNPRNGFDEYNFYSSKVKQKYTNWEDLRNNTPGKQLSKLLEKSNEFCKGPKRILNSHHKKRIPRDRKILFRKRKKKKKIIHMNKINPTKEKNKKSVDLIKDNPKYFHPYTTKE